MALPSTQVQFPTPTWQLTTVYNSSPRGSGALVWPLPGTHVMDRYTCK